MTPATAALLALLAARGVATAPLPGLSPLEATALDRVLASLPQRTVPALSDPLVQAARTLARSAAGGEPRPLSSSALRAALDAAGVVDPAPAAVVLSARAASLPEALAAASRFRGATHVGIGVVVRDDLAWAVLLASERRAELDPFPRRLAPGSTARLRGRLLDL
ncbi:MAG: SCP-like extracellular protein, partial [Anaeromyxobacteraceae bacterium]|nr:SCP-like extracellular protein [Anaeromyxobacteraceae bacterium]